jgi:carbon-monoxide dehydrogenase iron sulfur subunit
MIQVDITKCTGCRCCETACAFFRTGRVSPHLARIKVGQLYESGVDGPTVCVQCQERYCRKCPVSAIGIGPQGQVIVSPTICEECGSCEKRCPIGAIELFNDFVYVCDLCGGDPECVKACTEGAIVFLPDQSEVESLAELKKGAGKLNPSEKRRRYLAKRSKLAVKS